MVAEWLMKVISNMVLSHVISLSVLLGLNSYIFLKGRKTPLSMSYHILSVGPFLWLFGKIVKIVAPTLALRWFGIVIQYAGMTMLGPSFLIFCLTFYLHRDVPLRLRLALYAPSAVTFGLIVTNPLHHLFYPVFTMYRDSFGPVFYLNSWITYACLGGGAIFLAIELIRRGRRYRNQIILFIAAAAIPLLASFYYPRIGAVYSGLKFDITPVAFSFSYLCFGIAVFRYDFLDITRIAYGNVLEELPEGIVITDHEGDPLFSNHEAGSTLPLPRGDFSEGEIAHEGKIFSVRRSPVRRPLRREPFYVLNILDVSELEIRKARIRENTAKLADLTLTIGQRIQAEREILFLNERIRAAQELHDVLGHSLTLVISQLEGTRFIRDPAERAKRLDMIREELAEASGRLSASLNDSVSPAEDTPILLSRQLSDLADRCESDDRRVTLTLLGSEEPADTNTARNVYAICRECLTNSIRHGRARSIAMVIDFTSGLSVSITDNGEGCREIHEGTGLSGMRQRAEQLGGELRFSSLPGRGFSIHFTATEKMTKVTFTS